MSASESFYAGYLAAAVVVTLAVGAAWLIATARAALREGRRR